MIVLSGSESNTLIFIVLLYEIINLVILNQVLYKELINQ